MLLIPCFFFYKMDTINIKLGYVVNSGFSKIWGNNKGDDNLLGVQVCFVCYINIFIQYS